MRLRVLLGFVTGVACLALVVPVGAQTPPSYALVLANADGSLGPALRPTTVDCGTRRNTQTAPFGPENPPCNVRNGPTRISGAGLPVAQLVYMLSVNNERMRIEDKTGLAGLYEWDMTWTPEHLRGAAVQQANSNGPTVFAAVEQQLGLRLVPIQ